MAYYIINNSNIRAAYDEGRLEVKTVLDIALNNNLKIEIKE